MGEQIITGIHIDGCEFKGISDFSVERDKIEEYVSANTMISYIDGLTAEFTLKFNRITFYKFIGLWDWAVKNCPNRRVVHLMRYGGNDKVRLKNFNRSLRIISKVLSKGE